jgi:UDP-N-acetylglucosamine 2-epimerase (non-hydrolysing)
MALKTQHTSPRADELSDLPLRFVIVAGARPNFMKVAPLLNIMAPDPHVETVLVHTGQHYDDNMSGQFFRDLGLPCPDYHLGVGGGSHANQTSEIMRLIEPVLVGQKPHAVIVVGDVNSTLAAALVAKKVGLDVIHVEAGLRSFDRSMPEEINRIVTDSISDLLLVTEESGRLNLLREGISASQIHFVGNLMIDSLRGHLDKALRSDIRNRLGIGVERFGLVTLHRAANIDNQTQLQGIMQALEFISKQLPLYWPVHPRAQTLLQHCFLRAPERIHFLQPLGYLDFLCLQAQSAVVFTDSGGVQEESTVLGIPCLTLRDNTERPVTVEYGTNCIAGTSKETILRAWNNIVTSPKTGSLPPLWDGQAAARCRAVILGHYSRLK